MAAAELLESLRKIGEANEHLGARLASLNDAPNTAQPGHAAGIDAQGGQQPEQNGHRALSGEEKLEIRMRLKSLDNHSLSQFFFLQMQKKDSGIPLYDWLAAGGRSAQDAFGGISNQVDPTTRKAIDSGGVAALIRQDLEPVLYELFVRQFPFFDRVQKEPANGLVHAWNQITAYGDAAFMAELGTVTDDQSTYVRKTTNVAIIATRRGISLKSQFAVVAGGMNYNPEQLELQGGLRGIAHAMQRQIFSGNATATGGTYANEYGLYDANAFDGLRYLLGVTQGNSVNVDPATNPTTTGSIRRAVDSAIVPVLQNGGDAGSLEIWSHPLEKQIFDEQQDANVRILSAAQRALGVGVVTQAVNTIAGQTGWHIVPGDSIDPTVGSTGYATPNYPAATKVRDIYLIDPGAISIPYLGSEGPTVLDIPIGISGQLTRLFIVFGMWGLAPKALIWHNKLRVRIS